MSVCTSDPLRNAGLQHEASEFQLYAGSFLRDEARQIAFRGCSKRQHQVPVLLQLIVFVRQSCKTSLQLGFVRLQVCILALDSLHLRLIVKPPIFSAEFDKFSNPVMSFTTCVFVRVSPVTPELSLSRNVLWVTTFTPDKATSTHLT